LNLAVSPGEVLALLGPSGSGKSTVLRLLLGFAAPQSGAVCIDGQVASRDGQIIVPPERRRLAVVFQDLALWPHLTVYGNLAFGLASRRLPRSEQHGLIAAILAQLNLAGKERIYPGELSGGERQRVAIARALVLEPLAILLDEPLSNLDASLKRELLALFRQLFRERGNTVVYVTHDLREAAELGTRIAVIEQGRIVQEGNLKSLETRPATPFVRSLIEDVRWKRRDGP
jgi:ABC-type Fe3+/spermidine/putrescine transport system ATPase subunit